MNPENIVSRLAGCFVLALSLVTLNAEAAARKAPPPPVTKPAPSHTGGIGKGDTEFGVFGNITHYDDVKSTNVLLGFGLGKFLSDNLEMRVSPVIIYTDGPSSYDFSISPSFSLEYQFRNRSKAVPFVGGGLGILVGYGSQDSTSRSTFVCSSPASGNTCTTNSNKTNDTLNLGIFLFPTAGVKYFLSERTSLEYTATFQIGFLDAETSSYSRSTTTRDANGTTFSFSSNSSSSSSSGNLQLFQQMLRFNVYF